MKVKLYKYTPHIESFIKNPMLRCTPAHELNDPFELQLTENTVTEFKKLLEFDHAESYLNMSHSYNGVVSLSETKSNILMWSHYASEHKGGVIEFTFDVEYDCRQEMVQRGFISSIADNQYGFDRVKYRLEREPESDLYNTQGYDLYQNLRKHLFFTKADAWSYEKEHRFTCLLEAANNFCVPNDDDAKNVLARIGFQYTTAGFNPNLLLISDGFDYKKDPTTPLGKKGFKHLELTNSFKEKGIPIFHFFNIEPSSVTGIYLGCKSSCEVKKDTLKKFTSLGNEVYKVEICKKRYEMSFVRRRF